MIKMETCLETKVKENSYRLYCTPQAPLQEVIEALNELRYYCAGRLQEALEKAVEPQEENEQQQQPPSS